MWSFPPVVADEISNSRRSNSTAAESRHCLATEIVNLHEEFGISFDWICSATSVTNSRAFWSLLCAILLDMIFLVTSFPFLSPSAIWLAAHAAVANNSPANCTFLYHE